MNNLQIFNFQQNEIRTEIVDGELYFVGKDVAESIGYVNTKDALKNHVKNKYKRGSRITTPSGTQEMVVISQSGVFQLLGESHLPLADKFQDWLYEEVLPSINKTGGYQSQPTLRLPENNMEMLQVVQSVSAETNKRVDELSNQFTELKNEFGLPSKVAGKLKSHGAHKVYEHLGGSESNAYKEIGRKVFSEMWHDFKEHFGGLRSYYDLPLSQLQEGYTYINNWQPSTNTKMTISDLNAQIELGV